MKTPTTILALAATLGLAAAPAVGQGSYSIPSPRDARRAAEVARDHLDAGDLAAALDALEQLLGSASGALLPVLEAGQDEATHWIGAGPWVRQRLAEGPPQLRELFALRNEDRIAADLAAATAAPPGEREEALLDLLERYPTTPGSVRAWLAMGDLAFEAGQGDNARTAWDQAERAAALVPGVEPELDSLAAALAARRAAADGALAAAPDRRVTTPPRVDGAWFLDLPSSPVDSLLDHMNLRPVARGQRAWLNTGVRVLGVDTTRGELLWDSGEPSGWESLSSYGRSQLVRGVGLRDLVTSVALGSDTVVAPLQLPIARGENANVDGLTITVALPERRLFAFDAETGVPLWDHAPTAVALKLNPNGLSFPERARIAAPPVVVGDRVLVPCYELFGRINLFVAAYDLGTGAELWRTEVISGQQRVNLFGEHEVEFNSAPLAIAGDRALVLTQLGALVALDVETGEPQWATGYEQYELPKTRGYYTPERSRRWQNTPPVVHDGVVLATPVDGPNVEAFDLETGAPMWSAACTDLERVVAIALDGGATLDHLVAAGDDGLWFGGDVLAAFAGDVRTGPPIGLAHEPVPTPGALPGRGRVRPRALTLAGPTELVAPTDLGLVAVDRATGLPRDLGPYPRDGELAELEYETGSLALAPGRVLALDNWRLAGWLHWDTLIAEGRARHDAGPTPELRLELAEMLLARTAATRDGEGLLPGFLEDPATFLAEADGLLAELDGPTSLEPGRLDLARFRLLESQAAHAADRGEIDAALEHLARATASAERLFGSGADDERTRLASASLTLLGPGRPATTERRAHREAVLELLVGELGDEPLPMGLDRIEVEALAPGLLGQGGLDLGLFGSTSSQAWRNLARRLPIGLVARLARAETAAGPAEALADLHAALWAHGPLEVAEGVTLAPMLRAHLARTLDQPGAAAAYAPFEERAEELLQLALDRPAAERGELLAAVVDRFPFSRAGTTAEASLLDAHLARFRVSGKGLDALSTACLAAMQPGREGGGRAGLALAWALAEGGNHALARTWLERLLEDPATFSASADELRRLAPEFTGGATAAELLADLPPTPQDGRGEAAVPAPTFGPTLAASGSSGAVRLGAFVPLAILPTEDGRVLQLVSSNNTELLALESGKAGEIAWTFPVGAYSSLPWDRRVVALPPAAPERLCVLSSRGLVALDPGSGHYRWEASREGHRPLEVAGDGGLLLVEWLGPHGRLLEAFDAIGGGSLWTLDLARPDRRSSRVLGSRLLVEGHRAVLLDRDDRGPVQVVDLLTGRLEGELELGGHGEERDREAAWLADGHLFVPHFFAARGRRPNAIEAWDLAGVHPDAPLPTSFVVDLDATGELAGLAHADGKPYLWVVGLEGPDRLLELAPGLGALRLVATLEPDERPLGFVLGEATELDGGLVIGLRVPAPGAGRGENMVLRALDLPLGPLWSLELAQPADPAWTLYDGEMPAPALSTRSVAVVYALAGDHASRGQQTRLLVVDRETGTVTQDRPLTYRLGRADDIELVGLGEELMLFGRGSSASRGRLEIWGREE